MQALELQEFWSKKIFKIYVVTIRHINNKQAPDRKYVRVKSFVDDAQARRRAARIALENSVSYSASQRINYSVRLADPESDLGCTRVEQPPITAAA